ncbi:MAG TPA: hypothetical protein DHV77_02455 [Erysipelotrichaceae bacterium]|nr:hypothetical protein [Erysipelotrichaceae bacterium]
MAIQRERKIKEVKLLTDKVNRRISNIEKVMGRKESWAVKKLYDELESKQGIQLTKAGYVSKDLKDLSDAQLTSELKALRNFMHNKTSTVRGINEVRRKQIETMKRTIDDSDFASEDFTYEDAENLYDIWSDSRNRWVADKMGGSEYYQFVAEFRENTAKAIDMNDNLTKSQKNQYKKDAFIDQLDSYINVANDSTMRRKAVEFYNKYVK